MINWAIFRCEKDKSVKRVYVILQGRLNKKGATILTRKK